MRHPENLVLLDELLKELAGLLTRLRGVVDGMTFDLAEEQKAASVAADHPRKRSNYELRTMQ